MPAGVVLLHEVGVLVHQRLVAVHRGLEIVVGAGSGGSVAGTRITVVLRGAVPGRAGSRGVVRGEDVNGHDGVALGIVSDIDRVAGGVLRVEHGGALEVVDGESLLLQSLDIVVVRCGIGAAHLDVERARAIPLDLSLGGFRLGQLTGQIGRRP